MIIIIIDLFLKSWSSIGFGSIGLVSRIGNYHTI